jgi:hypothetical protein
MNYGETPNVDPEFHRVRAEQSANGFASDLRVVRLGFLLVEEPIGTKAILTICSVFCLNVTGMVLGAKALHRREIAIHVAEEFVGAGGLLFVGPSLDGIGFYVLPIA